MSDVIDAPAAVDLDAPSPANRRLSHAYCVVEREKGIVRGLCHTPMLGTPASHPPCQVCLDLINHHRRECPPCLHTWGLIHREDM